MSSIIDFGKMSHAEKKVWLKNIFFKSKRDGKGKYKRQAISRFFI